MGRNDGNEQGLFDMPKNQISTEDNKTTTFTQKEDGRISIKGRPNIDEISKRNEEEEKQDRISNYKITGIIVLLIIIVMVLVYFFS